MPLNPPPVIDSNLALVVQPLQRTDFARTMLLTYALHTTNPPSSADAQATINGFQTHFNTRYAPWIDTDVEILPPSIKLGDGGTTPFEAVATGAAVFGTNAIASVPPNLAVLIKKTTGLGGKTNRGRTYFPEIIDDSNINELGFLNPTFQGQIQTASNNFLNDLNAANYPMCIGQKVFNVPLPPHFVTRHKLGPVVTALTVEPQAATQRRRMRS